MSRPNPNAGFDPLQYTTMNTTPTPRTDDHVGPGCMAEAKFARELERELADSQAMVQGLKQALDKALEENLAMRDKLK